MDIGEGFARSRVSAALKSCASNAPHVALWQEEQADTLGYSLDTFKNWYYGRRAPDPDDLCRLIAHFGPRFLSVYLAPLGIVAVRTIDTASLDQAALNKMLRTVPTQLEGVARDLRALQPDEGE